MVGVVSLGFGGGGKCMCVATNYLRGSRLWERRDLTWAGGGCCGFRRR